MIILGNRLGDCLKRLHRRVEDMYKVVDEMNNGE